jgi:hypothetical protein
MVECVPDHSLTLCLTFDDEGEGVKFEFIRSRTLARVYSISLGKSEGARLLPLFPHHVPCTERVTVTPQGAVELRIQVHPRYTGTFHVFSLSPFPQLTLLHSTELVVGPR